MSNPSRAAVPGTTSSKPPRDLCVLVVEDNDADAYLISRALYRQPAVGNVVHAVDGVQALEMVERGTVRPDVAFIDLQMPRKSGLDLLMDFASQPELTFPMVVLTSSSASADAVRSRLNGAVRVMSKPETVEAMETTLAATIDAVCP